MRQQQASSKRGQVISALEDTDGWVTAGKVAAKAKVSHSNTRDHLHEIAETDALEKRRVLTELHTWEFRYVQLPDWWEP